MKTVITLASCENKPSISIAQVFPLSVSCEGAKLDAACIESGDIFPFSSLVDQSAFATTRLQMLLLVNVRIQIIKIHFVLL